MFIPTNKNKIDLYVIHFTNSRKNLFLYIFVYITLLFIYSTPYENVAFCIEENSNNEPKDVYDKILGCNLFVISVLIYFFLAFGSGSSGADPNILVDSNILAETGMRLVDEGVIITDHAHIGIDGGITVNNIEVMPTNLYIHADSVIENFEDFRHLLAKNALDLLDRKTAALEAIIKDYEDMDNYFFDVLVEKGIIHQDLLSLYDQLKTDNQEHMFREVLEGLNRPLR